MRAAWYDDYGPAREVLKIGILDDPEPRPGDVLVSLKASGVNPADVKLRSGSARLAEYPRVIPHSDGAGDIIAVGAGVDPRRVGQRVWLYNGQRNGRAFGTAAELIALDADLVTELPARVDYAEAATFGIPAMTAHRSLFAAGPVADKWILVAGGAGAVGHYAVQLAKWAGARVIATISSDDKAKIASDAGADHCINYRTENVVERIMAITGGVGIDHVVEVEFGANLDINLGVLRDNGSIASYASMAVTEPQVPHLSGHAQEHLDPRYFVAQFAAGGAPGRPA